MKRHNEHVKNMFRSVATLTAAYLNNHLPKDKRVKVHDLIPGEQWRNRIPPELEALRAKKASKS
jgi:hypothetical protein